jgi:hypothetical protein
MSFDRLSQAVKDDKAFRILVWGPGKKSPHYPIRDSLRKQLGEHFGQVEFSEEIKSGTPPPGSFWLADIAFQERLHATNANIVYLIPTSTGARLELILFWSYRNIAPKMHILLPKDHHEDSFIGRVTRDIIRRIPKHQLHVFATKDFTEDRICAYCIDHAKHIYVSTHPTGPPDFETSF